MQDGYVLKSLKNENLSDSEMNLINKFTRRKLKSSEVYVFSVVLCDNEIDREFERFSDESLFKLAQLFVGKTGITDHTPHSENQTARIFSCEIENIPGKFNSVRMPYKRLVAKAYMPRCPKNENFILEIDSGIKKEVSVGCAIGNSRCSICGKNSNECNIHIKGKKYRKNGIYEICHAILENPTDAYEWSFVAVPAQREAGVIKNFPAKFMSTHDDSNPSFDNICKKLSCHSELTLSEAETASLFDMITTLREKSLLGEAYKNKLAQDVMTLSGIVEPEISSKIMKTVIEKMNFDELKSFKDAYEKKLSKIIPCELQLSDLSDHCKKNHENQAFKI